MRPAVVTALLGLVLALTAATFDAEPLYVPAAAFVLLAVGAVAWVHLGSRRLEIARTVSARRVLEDDTVRIDIRVRTRSLALPAGLIEDPLLPAPAAIGAGRRTATVVIDARFARRGRKRLVEPSVIVRDPFGLAMRVVQGGGEAEILVLPRIAKVVTPAGEGDGTGLAARRGRPSVAAEVDLDGLRPHRPGAPASRMYWPALARSGELVERRLRADTDTRPLVVLDPRGAAGDAPLDSAVRAAGARPSRPRSTSTACARTGRGRPRRGCTGPRSRAAGSSSSGGCAPTPTRARWSSSTRAAPRATRRSTPPSAPPPRSPCTWPGTAAARCCSRATGARPCSSRRSPRGSTRTRGSPS